jgi:hypothetical protein
MRQNMTMDRPAKKPPTGAPGERDRRDDDDDREAVGTGDDELSDDDLDELEDDEEIEDDVEDDEA